MRRALWGLGATVQEHICWWGFGQREDIRSAVVEAPTEGQIKGHQMPTIFACENETTGGIWVSASSLGPKVEPI